MPADPPSFAELDALLGAATDDPPAERPVNTRRHECRAATRLVGSAGGA